MNTRFTFVFIRHLQTRRQGGFVLAIAMMVGLVVLVVGATLILRAQGDQSKVVSAQAKTIANAAAESGLSRVQNFLNTNPYLAKYSMDDWQNAVAAYDTDNTTTPTDSTKAADMMTQVVSDAKQLSCTYAPQTNDQVKSTIVTAMATMISGASQSLNDSNNSSYSLKKYYYYSDGSAKVLLAGQGGSDVAKGQSNLMVQIPVISGTAQSASTVFPGLWVKEYLRAGQGDSNPGTLDAKVVYDCSINVGTINHEDVISGSAAGYTNHISTNNAAGGKAIRVALPTGNVSTNDNAPKKSIIPMPNPPLVGSAPVTPFALGSVTGTLTLPRSGENNYDSGKDTYYYTISSILGNGVNLQFTPGKKVVVFLSGNILIGGKSQITHNCGTTTPCDATDVQILGAIKNSGGTINNGTFATTGNSAVCSILFWAPTYTVDMSGGGNAGDCPSSPVNGTYANQNGIYWVRAWIGGGQGSHQALNQTGSNWDLLKSVVALPVKNKLGTPTQWAMVDANYSIPTTTVTSTDTANATPNNTTACTVPNITGMTVTDVNSFSAITAAIVGAGLKGGTFTPTTSSTTSIANTQLTSQSPAAGTAVDCNTIVSYVYTLRNAQVPIAGLIGTSTSTGNGANRTVSLTAAQNEITSYASGCFVVGKEVGINTNGNGQLNVVDQSATLDGTLTKFTSNTSTPAKYSTCGATIDYSYNY